MQWNRTPIVRVTHKPTGKSVSIGIDRSLVKNKRTAMALLRSRVIGNVTPPQPGDRPIRSYDLSADTIKDDRGVRRFDHVQDVLERGEAAERVIVRSALAKARGGEGA